MTERKTMPEEVANNLRETAEGIISRSSHFMLIEVVAGTDGNVQIMVSNDDPMFKMQIAMALLGAQPKGE